MDSGPVSAYVRIGGGLQPNGTIGYAAALMPLAAD
jgi:hypothetical protein